MQDVMIQNSVSSFVSAGTPGKGTKARISSPVTNGANSTGLKNQ